MGVVLSVRFTNLPIVTRITSTELGQSHDCPNAREVTLQDIGKIVTLPNHIQSSGQSWQTIKYLSCESIVPFSTLHADWISSIWEQKRLHPRKSGMKVIQIVYFKHRNTNDIYYTQCIECAFIFVPCDWSMALKTVSCHDANFVSIMITLGFQCEIPI